MRKNETKKIVFTSIMIAMILVLSFVPNPVTSSPLGFIKIFNLEMTIIHIPVLIGAFILGKKYGMVLGTVFGLGSLIATFMYFTPYNAPFTNPLLSVVPRIIFVYFAVTIFNLLKNKIKNENIAIGLGLGIGSFLHTLIVVPLYYIFGATGFYFLSENNPFTNSKIMLNIITGIFTFNGLIEIALAVVIGLPIVKALNKIIVN